MTRNEAKKLILLEVPAGLKMKYQHFYSSTDGRPVRKIEDLETKEHYWAFCDENPVRYDGTRVLDQSVAWLEDAQGVHVAEGWASCNPKDTPNKKLGRAIAHNRCIKDYVKSRNANTIRLIDHAHAAGVDSAQHPELAAAINSLGDIIEERDEA